MKSYKKKVKKALDNVVLRAAMDRFFLAYRQARETAFEGLDREGLIREVARIKDTAVADLDVLYDRFRAEAGKKGIIVHLARDAQHANEIISTIARVSSSEKIIKSKSMTAEETLLNRYLEDKGFTVTETDLGEWIIQLRGEGPSHMVMPAIHLSRLQVADLFSNVTGRDQEDDIEKLVKVARRELRREFVQADMGITGANFVIADTATIGLNTNEGNARLVTTLPRIHVVLAGLDKLVPSLDEALAIMRVLPRNATGQRITSYVTWISGPAPWQGTADQEKQLHIVFLDNGRRKLAKDPVFSQALRCVRCGACTNVCPVYRMVGGHGMGHIYMGAIGLILTYFFHGREKARDLVKNCINCGACRSVCAAGIDLPRIIKAVHSDILDQEGHPIKSILLSRVLRSRKLFHGLLKSARRVQGPLRDDQGFIRHLPHIFSGEYRNRQIPAIAETPFRDRFESIVQDISPPRFRIALFAGCVQDFVYPEQLAAAMTVFRKAGVAVEFPLDQSCCGLPVDMMGEKETAQEVAARNVLALNPETVDYVVTLCASCAAFLKNDYPGLLARRPSLALRARALADKTMVFSTFCHTVWKPDTALFRPGGVKTTYHAPCHLCRGLKETRAPHALFKAAGLNFVPAGEEETCCGFGGTYSTKFPDISGQILERKLDDIEQTRAACLVTECPGCILQLRGGAGARGMDLDVRHLAEVLCRQLIKKDDDPSPGKE